MYFKDSKGNMAADFHWNSRPTTNIARMSGRLACPLVCQDPSRLSQLLLDLRHFSIHQQIIDQFIAQILITWHVLMLEALSILQLTFVNLATRSKPILMVRFVSTSWRRVTINFCLLVSRNLHCSGVLLIIHVPFICQDLCKTRVQVPPGRLTREPVLAEHFGFDWIKPLHCLFRFVTFPIFHFSFIRVLWIAFIMMFWMKRPTAGSFPMLSVTHSASRRMVSGCWGIRAAVPHQAQWWLGRCFHYDCFSDPKSRYTWVSFLR